MYSFHFDDNANHEQMILKKWLKVSDLDEQRALFPPLHNDTCSPTKVSESDVEEFLTSIPHDSRSDLEDISHSNVSFDGACEHERFCYSKYFKFEEASCSKSELGESSSSMDSVNTNFTFSSTKFGMEYRRMLKNIPSENENRNEINPLANSNYVAEDTKHLYESKIANFPGKHKKRRKRFKPEQQKLLNSIFSKNQYFSSNKSELARLAGSFGVPQKTVRVWFQNKRTYWKKKNSNLEF